MYDHNNAHDIKSTFAQSSVTSKPKTRNNRVCFRHVNIDVDKRSSRLRQQPIIPPHRAWLRRPRWRRTDEERSYMDLRWNRSRTLLLTKWHTIFQKQILYYSKWMCIWRITTMMGRPRCMIVMRHTLANFQEQVDDDYSSEYDDPDDQRL